MARSVTAWLDGAILVALLGLAFVVGGVVFWLEALAPAAGPIHAVLYELVIHVGFGGIVLGIGLDLERSTVPTTDRRSVLAWCYGGFVIMLGLSVWGHLDVILAGTLTTAFVSDFVVFTSLGAAFGGIAGVNWARASANARLATRNDDQRETLALVARLVSHDIRNDLMLIDGHLASVADHVAAGGESSLEVVRDRIDETHRLLEDVSALVRTIGDDEALEPVELSTVLLEAVYHVRTDHPEVTLETDIASDLPVRANALLPQVFTNLLTNAIAHNDPADLTIDVSATRRADEVVVDISDDGQGIPPAQRERCFELGETGPDSDGDGIGLYLVSRLVDRYGGTIDLKTGPLGGARFTMTFPAIDGGNTAG